MNTDKALENILERARLSGVDISARFALPKDRQPTEAERQLDQDLSEANYRSKYAHCSEYGNHLFSFEKIDDFFSNLRWYQENGGYDGLKIPDGQLLRIETGAYLNLINSYLSNLKDVHDHNGNKILKNISGNRKPKISPRTLEVLLNEYASSEVLVRSAEDVRKQNRNFIDPELGIYYLAKVKEGYSRIGLEFPYGEAEQILKRLLQKDIPSFENFVFSANHDSINNELPRYINRIEKARSFADQLGKLERFKFELRTLPITIAKWVMEKKFTSELLEGI